jgi:glutamate synthase (NADPH/NADH) small chain
MAINKPAVDMPRQNPEERIKNFNEVALGYTKELALEEASRCLNCKNPQCIKGCPVNIDIPSFINLIKEEKFKESAQKIKEYNALPAICGRVCPQENQCQRYCIMGIRGSPVEI